ncbi:cyclin-D3-3-like [Cynara cardunculus var. scolymus]|uniref:Cyclin, C-terminal domain-containing protein n=1 Tax=Cynara cardunculus var. scolymus TaxID=59895 RepID=A0A103Y558_CYNCS|nr:cyclin-D3-3-like [Cynara cardunculus var. scolymus]KVI02706.1 Cyclin, C-terminal domain-containing protein [Cynara cardunculus var. scolymus]
MMKEVNVCSQNPTFAFEDGLFCDEQEKDLDFGCGFDHEIQISKRKDHLFTHFEHDLLWEEDELSSLLSKEKNNVSGDGDLICNEVLMGLRKESVDWMIRVSTHYGFVAMTTILAVNYFDRFLLSPSFQREKPWMSQLAAVACLSIASKVEEIQAPLLLDLQVEGSKFMFESKTIMKMELLVLSSLQWKMNPVTPLSFYDYIMRRLGLITHHLHSEFVRRCERIVLAVINDSRSLVYLPSVMATATMILVIKEVDPTNALDYQNLLKGFLEINEEEVDDCSKFILEVSDNHGTKRKYHFAPGSPSGVIDSYFSSDNSSDSWAVASSSVSSSPEKPLFKKIRAQEQQMRLGPVCRVSIRTLNNAH